jgi:5-methylcytosine-specific restriction protein A
VWQEYRNDQLRLRKVAAAIRSFIESDVPVSTADVLQDDDELAPEGRLLVRVHRSYERKPENRQKKLSAFRKANNGHIFCECCGFDFEATYGDRGAGFIECHHQLPLSLLKPHQFTKLSDLRLLCCNCHRMIHVRQPWMLVEELRVLRQASPFVVQTAPHS